jgi:hypothetical protein
MTSAFHRFASRIAPRLAAVALVAAVGTSTLHAQFFTVPVFDVSNFAEAIIQAADLVTQINQMVFQATRLPLNMAARYHAFSPIWTGNTLTSLFPSAAPVLSALNLGDPLGNGYKQVVDPLDLPLDVIARMPVVLQRRFMDNYATIQLADSVATMGIDHSGTVRTSGNVLLQVLQSMESDAFSTLDSFHTQTALLNKINGAAILNLRVGEETNQFLSSAVEQLVVDNKRKRDTEARIMNATINQWRWGQAYGNDIFGRTAADIDNWRLR